MENFLGKRRGLFLRVGPFRQDYSPFGRMIKTVPGVFCGLCGEEAVLLSTDVLSDCTLPVSAKDSVDSGVSAILLTPVELAAEFSFITAD